MPFKPYVKNTLTLGLLAFLTTATVALTYFTSQPKIIKAQHETLKNTLYEVLPNENFNNDLPNDYIAVKHPLLGLSDPQDAFLARLDGQASAVIVPAIAPEGYGGAITLLVGIRYDGSITGVRVAGPHHETPGLGDKIELAQSDWILGFNGKSLNDPPKSGWKVKKDGGDFDEMTGATVTPRAVVKAVYNSLEYFEHNKKHLFHQATAEQKKQKFIPDHEQTNDDHR